MAFEMTEEYASAMVTVIPVLMIVATVEVQTLAKRREVQPPPDDANPWTVFRNYGPMVQLGLYGLLAASHGVAELKLITWLATTQRDPDPTMARDTALIGMGGFVYLTVLTYIVVFVNGTKHMSWAMRGLHRLLTGRPGHTGRSRPRAVASPRVPRQRPRPIAPAQRAMRGSQRSRRRPRVRT
ncbi:hypothetical protein [Streptomyces sp. SudanB66_2053]|uniref:hypothetical protein n=1 Tax=Streptomyces sp. SudanB66_2053 TaxID=3035277 RepID=UPI003F57D46D